MFSSNMNMESFFKVNAEDMFNLINNFHVQANHIEEGQQKEESSTDVYKSP